MIVVLDASAAIEIALNKQDAPFFKKILLQSELVLAPDLFPSEITNIFWKYNAFSGLSSEHCAQGMAFCCDLIDDYVSTRHLCAEVLSESVRTKHPAYDIFYLVLARRNDAHVLTKDKKMILIAKEMKIKIKKPDA
jgi:predicted nucleic acid-binding protein